MTPTDPNAYGSRMRELIEGLMRSGNTIADADVMVARMRTAAKVLKQISTDSDAILHCMFIGYGAGGQRQGAVILPQLFAAMQAGYEARIHEIATEGES